MTVDMSQLNFPVGRMRRDQEEGQREKLVHPDGNSLRGGRSRTSLRQKEEGGKTKLRPSLHPSTQAGIFPLLNLGIRSKVDMDADKSSSEKLVLEFKEDTDLTEMMRRRVSSLQKTGQKRQDGERLLLPHEAVHRLDFPVQELNFSRWYFSLSGHGRVTITGISQHWTPDLTNLMTRQLLEPIGTFWRNAEDPEDSPLKCLEADMQEFGERIAELAKVRKVMYFLFAYKDGSTAGNLDCTIEFIPEM